MRRQLSTLVSGLLLLTGIFLLAQAATGHLLGYWGILYGLVAAARLWIIWHRQKQEG